MKPFTFLKTSVLLSLTILLFCFSSCNILDDNESEELPPVTQTGENTFGAIVDGRVFIPKDKICNRAPGGGIPKGISVIRGVSYFSIAVSNYENIYIYIYIYIHIPENVPQEKTYTFKLSNGEPADGDEPHCFAIFNNVGYLSYENSGTITFTKIDEVQGIIAGTFSLQLKNKNNVTDIVEITAGRFDI